MRFSMKWALAAMAYVAVAAAAFSRQTWVFADLLWAASLLAVVFAALVAGFARGPRQIAAAGFVVASGCYLLCLQFGAAVVPAGRLLAAAGIHGNGTLTTTTYAASPRVIVKRTPVTETRMTDAGPVRTVRMVEEQVTVPTAVVKSPLGPPPVATAAWNAPTPVSAQPLSVARWMASADSAMSLSRAGNSVGMMVFGLLGCVVGLLAHKAARGNLDHCVA